MLRYIMVFFVLVSMSYGCKMQWVYGKSASGCLVVEGKKREFSYFMPEHARGVVLPLVIGLHGGGGNAKRFEKYTGFSTLAKKSASFIMVYPKGIKKHWNDGRSSVNSDVDDVEFISKLIEIVPRVDKTEVYAVGMSNGGLMAQKLACEIAPKLKGLAVVSATMSNVLIQDCKDNIPLEAVFIFGTKDNAFLDNGDLVNPVNPLEVRGHHIGIDKTLLYWEERNKCESLVVKEKRDKYNKKWGKFKNDGTMVFVNDYQKCSKRLRYYKVVGGGHRWPDKDASNGFIIKKFVGIASLEITSAEEIINFFRLIKR